MQTTPWIIFLRGDYHEKNLSFLGTIGLAVFTTVIAFGTQGSTATASELVNGYYEYDYTTHEETYHKDKISLMPATEMKGALGTLGNSSTGEIEPFNIFGSDDRVAVPSTTVVPTRWIGYLISHWSDGSVTRGTAWLYGESVAATAGQNVYNYAKGEYASKIEFIPGYNGNQPYGSYTATKVKVTRQWKNNKDREFNVGLIKISSPIGREIGYFGIEAIEGDFSNTSVWITGYVKSKNYKMYRMKGKLTGTPGNGVETSGNGLLHEIDTSAGQEGAPIF